MVHSQGIQYPLLAMFCFLITMFDNAPHFPQTRLKAALYIGQDQIGVGKKPSATLLLNMGIICACEWLYLPHHQLATFSKRSGYTTSGSSLRCVP